MSKHPLPRVSTSGTSTYVGLGFYDLNITQSGWVLRSEGYERWYAEGTETTIETAWPVAMAALEASLMDDLERVRSVRGWTP